MTDSNATSPTHTHTLPSHMIWLVWLVGYMIALWHTAQEGYAVPQTVHIK